MNIQVIDSQNHLWLQILRRLRYDVYHLPEYAQLEAKRTASESKAFIVIDGDKIFFLPFLIRSCNDILGSKAQNFSDAISPYGYPGVLLSEAATNESKFTDFALKELNYYFKSEDICSAFFQLHPILSNGDKISQILSGKAEGRRQKAEGNSDSCPMPVTEGNKGIKPHRLYGAYNWLGSETPSNCSFRPLPSAFCLRSSQNTVNKIGETISVDLKLSESQIWANTRKGHQSTINKCKRLGFTARMVNLVEYIENFQAIYKETMNRVAAKQSYYFDQQYFVDLQNLDGNIHLCLVELESEIAAACIFFECGKIVQAHLGGTKNKFLQQSPFNYLLDYVRYWAKQRGNELMHIGSGVGGTKDSLYHFKAGFSKQRHDWFALQLIPDWEKYTYLTHLRAESLNTKVEKLFQSNFFPAYRSG